MSLWTLPEGARTIMSRLTNAGYRAHVVGGSVRDLLRGIPPHDYDMTTDATPDEMKQVFFDMRTIETGIKHGTLTVLADGVPYEVTTYRVDGDYRDHRHPDEVSFTRSLEEDLARRDFTMNAIAYHPDTGITDPHGGEADIAAHMIRAVGEPTRRFQEDALRILRGIRFAATLDYEIEPATASAMLAERELLGHVSAERVREELMRLLAGTAAARIVREYLPVLQVRLPGIKPPTERVLHALATLPADPSLRLFALLLPAYADHPARMDDLLGELKFDNATRRRIATLASVISAPMTPRDAEILRLLAVVDKSGFSDLCAMRRAYATTHAEAEVITRMEAMALALVDRSTPYRVSDLAVNGSDIIAKTSLRGVAVGEALDRLLAAVMDGSVPNEREALLAFLN